MNSFLFNTINRGWQFAFFFLLFPCTVSSYYCYNVAVSFPKSPHLALCARYNCRTQNKSFRGLVPYIVHVCVIFFLLLLAFSWYVSLNVNAIHCQRTWMYQNQKEVWKCRWREKKNNVTCITIITDSFSAHILHKWHTHCLPSSISSNGSHNICTMHTVVSI